ncbi:hypothetical protein [uncultured Croceitalea sp.]|uniref:FKBP-type peptidyl-prolyl cis-trans isomerase n=1 Tax=uncultured Croceitalea sp. TaxID=1798908 RepID=UPI003305EF04
MNRIFGALLLIVLITACNNDDDGLGGEVVPPRELDEVAAENDAEIRTFLQTHFYNYEEFQSPPADFDFKIVIDTIAGENSDKTPLLNQVEEIIVQVSAFEFLLEGQEDVDHKYYYLEARPGIGDKPTIADSTFVNYQGSLLDGTVFDEVNTGTWWDNPSFQFAAPGFQKAFRGVGEGVTNTAEGGVAVTNPDGTFDVEGYGIGMIVLPSALATFNGNRGQISGYDPVIFKYDVLRVISNSDHDNDGIPSIMEDVDGDGLLPSDDTDGDRTANYQDPDDDGDGTLTRDEISDEEGNIIFPYPDTDGDGTPDYLDPDNS